MISETNCSVDLPARPYKATIYNVNLLIPYYKLSGFVNLLIVIAAAEVEEPPLP